MILGDLVGAVTESAGSSAGGEQITYALENRRQVAERVEALLERLVARWCGVLA
jgi:hypothetical protein